MKKVLLIDGSPLFCGFLKEKLATEQVQFETAGKREALTRLITTLPDLLIIEIQDSIEEVEDFLEHKFNDPNAKKTPIIMCGPRIEHSQTARLLQFGVTKYFTKPIKFDVLFESIGRILHSPFSLDDTQSVCDVHTNDNIIFVEISQGLNREKINLLKFQIPEIIEKNELKNPKLILMLTNLTLSFVDAINLELLLDNLVISSGIPKRYIKILTLDDFARQLVDGHVEYAGIECVTNLMNVLSNFVDSNSYDATEVVTNKILSSDGKVEQGDVEMRFKSDSGDSSSDDADGMTINTAVIDDDVIVRNLLKTAFTKMHGQTQLFASGEEFLAAYPNSNLDVIILDLFMPTMNGIEVLKKLQAMGNTVPILVYSQATQRELVVQSLSLGAKSYVVKPQKPEVLMQKVFEAMHS